MEGKREKRNFIIKILLKSGYIELLIDSKKSPVYCFALAPYKYFDS